MYIREIHFKNFRNLEDSKFKLNQKLTIVIGENSRGKTNLLEGIYFLINGTGFREAKEEELINYDSQDIAQVEGIYSINNDSISFSVKFSKKNDLIEKNFYINKTKKNYRDYVLSNLKSILFEPSQIEIIIGGPDKRRDYFNKIISSFDFEYRKKLKDYEQALRRRNKILEKFTSLERLKEELKFWNDYLEKHAAYITSQREQYLSYLNKHSKVESKNFSISYLKSELTAKNLEANFEKEIRWRRTLVGPQKDDFQINIEGKNVHAFGSRSQQRLAILWLKLNEINFYEEKFRRKPILLFDDIFSELDVKNRKLVLHLIKKYQTIATTTDEHVLNLVEVPKSEITLQLV
jgi:DNA replication and repair protein RecF